MSKAISDAAAYLTRSANHSLTAHRNGYVEILPAHANPDWKPWETVPEPKPQTEKEKQKQWAEQCAALRTVVKSKRIYKAIKRGRPVKPMFEVLDECGNIVARFSDEERAYSRSKLGSFTVRRVFFVGVYKVIPK